MRNRDASLVCLHSRGQRQPLRDSQDPRAVWEQPRFPHTLEGVVKPVDRAFSGVALASCTLGESVTEEQRTACGGPLGSI